MSIWGFVMLAGIVVSVVLTLRLKSAKSGWFLFILYLLMLPFFALAALLSESLFFFFVILASPVVIGIIVLILRICRIGEYEPDQSRPYKLALCAVLAVLLLYLEGFNGIETFDRPSQFFQIKTQIGMGHWIPYRLDQTESIKGTDHARYIGPPVFIKHNTTFFSLFFTAYDLYYHDGQLYYTYWDDTNIPYSKWGEKLDVGSV